MRSEELEVCNNRRGARLDFCDLLDEDLYDPAIDPQDFLTPEEIAADPNRAPRLSRSDEFIMLLELRPIQSLWGNLAMK